jgi:hypothetical protein
VGIAKSILTRITDLGEKVAWRFSAAVDMDEFKQILASLTRSFITLSQNHLALLESQFQLSVKVESQNQFS